MSSRTRMRAFVGPAAAGRSLSADLELAIRGRALFGVAFSCSPIGMAVVDEHGRITLANDALAGILGRPPRELAGLAMDELIVADEQAGSDNARTWNADGRELVVQTQVRLRRGDGSTVWTALTVSHADDPSPCSFIQVQDVSEPRELEGRLEYLLDHDHLTGLFNRHRFQQELERELARQQRFGDGGAVLMVDLDGFKSVNDRFGHASGDELLRSLSAEMRERSRDTDVVARLSGDEFALLLPGVDREQAETVAANLLGLVRSHVSTLGRERAHVTASVGIALFDHLGDVELLALADAAMYAAKEAGRDRYVVFNAGDEREHSRRASEAGQLHRALEQNLFVLYCQPIWDISHDRVDQYELLIRMQGGEDGELIAPNAFLYAAERFGLITAIDCWVISQAIALVAAEERRGRRVRLAVNLSGRSIADPALSAHIDHELDTSRIDPSSLTFEITETAAIGSFNAAQALSARLHQRGCRLALDDFGAGFASFYYLKNLPFDYIKIDGDFIRGLGDHPTDQLIVSAIVTIAKGMGIETIAEFVADQQTSDLLATAGVDHIQGYHVARPQPVEHVLATR